MRRTTFYILVALGLLCVACGGAGNRDESKTELGDTDFSIPDTLRVATLYSPTSYFMFRDEEMGYDYTLIRSFAKSKDVTLSLEVVPALSRAVEMLDSGLVDVIAYPVPVTSQYRKTVYPCGPQTDSYQVLVQRRDDKNPIHDVTDLVGREVWVEKTRDTFTGSKISTTNLAVASTSA